MTSSPRPALYEAFWSRYLERLAADRQPWGADEPSGRNYLEQQSWLAGCWIAPGFKADSRVSHELVVDSRNRDWNTAAFTWLRERRSAVEATYGRPLEWDERPGRSRCLIGEYTPGTIEAIASPDQTIAWLVDCGTRLRGVVDRFRTQLHAALGDPSRR